MSLAMQGVDERAGGDEREWSVFGMDTLPRLFRHVVAERGGKVAMREKEGTKIFFLLNHQSSSVRIQFYKPMHDYLTGNTFSGSYDLAPHSILVLDEHPEVKPEAHAVAT